MNYVKNLVAREEEGVSYRRKIFNPVIYKFYDIDFTSLRVPLSVGYEYDLPFLCIEVSYHTDTDGWGTCRLKDFVKLAEKQEFIGVSFETVGLDIFFVIKFCLDEYTSVLFSNLEYVGSSFGLPDIDMLPLGDSILCQPLEEDFFAEKILVALGTSDSSMYRNKTFVDAFYTTLIGLGMPYAIRVSSDYEHIVFSSEEGIARGTPNIKYKVKNSLSLRSFITKVKLLSRSVKKVQ